MLQAASDVTAVADDATDIGTVATDIGDCYSSSYRHCYVVQQLQTLPMYEAVADDIADVTASS